ncbi:MAG TPA: GIY-YIG nuclease family protein [Terriglobales bacterium]
MQREYRFYVYMMQSNSRRTLYIGMTNNLYKRVFQHKTHEFRGFTYDYDAVRLVYWESFDDVHKAINREKQLKNWRRDKKEWLIQRVNPGWKDLAADWYGKEETQGPSTPLRFARDDRSVVDQNAAAAPEAGTDPSIQASHKNAS